jgi:RNA polymerase sigma-70 factor (ECF subfamily)
MRKGKSVDKSEIAQLIDEHRKLIYKVVNSYCANLHEQEDLIQEIIFHLLKGYEKFDHKVKVTTWMYKVAFNVAISHYRKHKTRQRYVVPMPEKLVLIDETKENDTDQSLQRLRHFIEELNGLNKAVLIMFLDGNSHKEISKVLGISVSNVGTKINRIKNLLKEKFNQQ